MFPPAADSHSNLLRGSQVRTSRAQSCPERGSVELPVSQHLQSILKQLPGPELLIQHTTGSATLRLKRFSRFEVGEPAYIRSGTPTHSDDGWPSASRCLLEGLHGAKTLHLRFLNPLHRLR